MSRFAVILAAAGNSSRFKDQNYKKPYAPLDGRAVWLHSAERFLQRDDVRQVIVVISADDRELFQAKFGANIAILGIELALGGAERADSVRAGLAKLQDDVEYVAVHDAARPVLSDKWIDAVFASAKQFGAAILATPVTSTLKRVGNDEVIRETVDRRQLWEAQTPQVFRRDWLQQAHALPNGADATDDAELVQRLGHAVRIVPGSNLNIKITTREDLKLAELALKALPKPKLEGMGNPFGDGDMWR